MRVRQNGEDERCDEKSGWRDFELFEKNMERFVATHTNKINHFVIERDIVHFAQSPVQRFALTLNGAY